MFIFLIVDVMKIVVMLNLHVVVRGSGFRAKKMSKFLLFVFWSILPVVVGHHVVIMSYCLFLEIGVNIARV